MTIQEEIENCPRDIIRAKLEEISVVRRAILDDVVRIKENVCEEEQSLYFAFLELKYEWARPILSRKYRLLDMWKGRVDKEDLIGRAKEVSIVKIAEEGGMRLIKSGERYKALCPFHEENTPSFVLYPDTNTYYCFGCHVSGDVIELKMKIDGIGFKEAVKELV